MHVLSQRINESGSSGHPLKAVPPNSPESLNLSTDGYEQYIPPTDTEHEYQGLAKNTTSQTLHGGYLNTARNISDERNSTDERNSDYEEMPEGVDGQNDMHNYSAVC